MNHCSTCGSTKITEAYCAKCLPARIKELEADLAKCETENNNLRQQTVDMAHLEAENERLKQDAARLDYCFENGMIENYDVSLGYSIYLYDREAIDAAITESEEEKK